ncbi:hypothetical protein [Salidesulfovibrio brasiliensis]|uniref:hypothetical protein n=1 Tax=Salidesulfovibrio brasiliensis TaxID=221711 RepID=UPI0006D0A409|nr:hypothetical protein [Salidesulfovibrio brasiliensis]
MDSTDKEPSMTACTAIAILMALVFAGFTVSRIFYPEGWYSANAALLMQAHQEASGEPPAHDLDDECASGLSGKECYDS